MTETLTQTEVITNLILSSDNNLFRSGSIGCDGYIHDTQIECAKNILLAFNRAETRRNHVILVAKMQSGKTGAVNAVVNIVNALHLDKTMMVNKFFFLCGMNDCGLKEQTFERVIKQVSDATVENTYNGKRSLKYKTQKKYFLLKNSDLMGFDGSIDNSILFIDECHYGSGKKNKLTQFLEKQGINWRNPNELISRNIYIVSVSATPFSEVISDVNECKEIIELPTNSGYVGVSEYINEGLVHDAKSHCEDVGDILLALREGLTRCKADGIDGIFFVRTRKNEELVERNFVKYNFDVYQMDASTSKLNYDKLSDRLKEQIDAIEFNKKFEGVTLPILLEQKIPTKPLLVLIKGAFRAGVTIHGNFKDYTYLVYDYSLSAAATAQALLGRMCGYRSENKRLNTLFFVNKFHATQYSQYEQNFADRENVPTDKTEKEWVCSANELDATSVLASAPCGNFAIDLTKEEVEFFFSRCKGRKSCSENAKIIFDKMLKDKNIDCSYDYFNEAHMQGKNNYAVSSQVKRFDSFTSDSLVFGFRADKLKQFQLEKNRDYLTTDDFGLSCVSLVLDAEIDKNSGTCIGGNMRLLVYHTMVGAFKVVPSQKSMYQQHKDTSLI